MAKQVVIDCYGHPNTDARFRMKEEKWSAIAEADGAAYFKFGSGEKTPVHRIVTDQSGITTQLWAFGRWDDRESLTYDLTLNETRAIDME